MPRKTWTWENDEAESRHEAERMILGYILSELHDKGLGEIQSPNGLNYAIRVGVQIAPKPRR